MDEQRGAAQFSIGSRVARLATGYLEPNGVVRGGPLIGDKIKRRVTLRLDPDVLDKFRGGGPGWHGLINAALRKAARL